ncbi:MAG: hypothetical protein IT287_04955 [Bdellovibrionaceae bacterium]|nr:hypothetical protein [Pseudobdellovibrionaceae bacterium]
MLKALVSIIIVCGLVACGKEEGVKARLHKKTTPAPDQVAQQAFQALSTSGKEQGNMNSISSQAIRKDTLGFRVKTTPGANATLDLRVEHFTGFDANKCRNSVQDMNIPVSKLAGWNTSKTLSMRCYDGNCKFMLLILEQGISSFADGTGQLLPAFVPVILETKDVVDGPRYYYPSTAMDPFLNIAVNTICNPSDQVIRHETQYVIAPIDDTGGPDYNYFPDPDNNTWIY